MTVSRQMTKEDFEKILRTDDSMPKSFTVLEAVVSERTGSFIVKWIDDAEYEAWEDAIAEPGPDTAAKIEATRPVERFSQVWENDDPDDENAKAYAVRRLDPDEIGRFASSGETFRPFV